jgi:hypothetical protein
VYNPCDSDMHRCCHTAPRLLRVALEAELDPTQELDQRYNDLTRVETTTRVSPMWIGARTYAVQCQYCSMYAVHASARAQIAGNLRPVKLTAYRHRPAARQVSTSVLCTERK